jgi:hypothetical protein
MPREGRLDRSDGPDVAENIRTYTEAYSPQDQPQKDQVRAMALAQARIDVATRKVLDDVDHARERAVGSWQREQQERVLYLDRRLPLDPERSSHALEGSPLGNQHKVALWEDLSSAAEIHGY